MKESDTRALTEAELTLVRWMLEQGSPEARQILPQLDLVRVTSWTCGCGCASFDLVIPGGPTPPTGMNVLADFLIEVTNDGYSGIFIYECGGVLSGVELHGVPEAPRKLPTPKQLQPYLDAAE